MTRWTGHANFDELFRIFKFRLFWHFGIPETKKSEISKKISDIFTYNPNEALGPLHISLGRTINELYKWFFLFLMIFLAFLLGLFKLYSNYGGEELGIKPSTSPWGPWVRPGIPVCVVLICKAQKKGWNRQIGVLHSFFDFGKNFHHIILGVVWTV